MSKLRISKDGVNYDVELQILTPDTEKYVRLGSEYLPLTTDKMYSLIGPKLSFTKDGRSWYPYIELNDEYLMFGTENTFSTSVTLDGFNKDIEKDYSYQIDWGDGKYETVTIPKGYTTRIVVTHTYALYEAYRVKIKSLNPDYEDFWYPISFEGNNSINELIYMNGNYLGVNGQKSICHNMFDGCNKLVVLPSDFTLPQGLINVGDNFCRSMFQSTELNVIPNSFKLPTGLTEVGDDFCRSMFEGCNISEIHEGFTLLNNSSLTFGNYIYYSMFAQCSLLETLLSTFIKPSYINSSCSNYNGADMFYRTEIPVGTNDFPDCCW